MEQAWSRAGRRCWLHLHARQGTGAHSKAPRSGRLHSRSGFKARGANFRQAASRWAQVYALPFASPSHRAKCRPGTGRCTPAPESHRQHSGTRRGPTATTPSHATAPPTGTAQGPAGPAPGRPRALTERRHGAGLQQQAVLAAASLQQGARSRLLLPEQPQPSAQSHGSGWSQGRKSSRRRRREDASHSTGGEGAAAASSAGSAELGGPQAAARSCGAAGSAAAGTPPRTGARSRQPAPPWQRGRPGRQAGGTAVPPCREPATSTGLQVPAGGGRPAAKAAESCCSSLSLTAPQHSCYLLPPGVRG